jgi:[acyl-carrier-protein] S-malonyltransferase
MQTALDDQINLFLEFGGGIGPGNSPADKRPNLEGMIKKFTRRVRPRPNYLPAINIETIKEAAGN